MRNRKEIEARWKGGTLLPITPVPEEIELLLDIRDEAFAHTLILIEIRDLLATKEI